MNSKSTEKIQSISIMRVIAMTMIILFHSLCFYTHRWWKMGGVYVPFWDKLASFLDAIDLPMFVFISGYLFSYLYINKGKYRNTKVFIQKKIKRLLVPYMIWGIFLNLCMPSIHDWKAMLTGISHLWFLLMLTELFALAALFKRHLCTIFTRRKLIAFIILSICIYYLSFFFLCHKSFMCIHISLYYLPYFLSGIYCSRFLCLQKSNIKYAGFILIFSILFLLYYIFRIQDPISPSDYIFILITSVTIIVSFLIILERVSKYIKNFKIIRRLDEISMAIYIFNQIIIDTFLLRSEIVVFLNCIYKVGPFIIFTAGLLFSYYLSIIFINNKYLRWTVG